MKISFSGNSEISSKLPEETKIDVFVEKAIKHSETFIYGDMKSKLKIDGVGHLFKFTSSFEHKVGFYYTVEGKWSTYNGKPQFAVDNVIEERKPKTVDGAIKFLQTFSDIGPSRAQKIIEKLGDNPIDRIMEDPMCICEFVGEKRAKEISESINYDPEMFIFKQKLMSINVSPHIINKIFEYYGSRSIEEIKVNPYGLIHLDGVGFKTVDSIALKIGKVSLDDENRMRCITSFIIKDLIEKVSGSTVFNVKMFMKECKVALKNINSFDKELAIKSLYKMIDSGDVIKLNFEKSEDDWFQLKQTYEDELFISKRIMREVKDVDPVDLSPIKNLIENMSSDQLSAIAGITSQKIAVLTGGPGTGKSYIINSAKQAFRSAGMSVCVVAPTGKAASNVFGMTIHRALGWGVGGHFGPTMTIDTDVLIVDESSMINNDLMIMLIANTDKKTRIVFVGDPDQLPPIGKGEPFYGFIKSNSIPVFKLTKIHRVKGDSAIPFLAKEIREGEEITIDDPSVKIIEDANLGRKSIRGEDVSPLDLLTDKLIEEYVTTLIIGKKLEDPITVDDIVILVPYSSNKMKPNTSFINSVVQEIRFRKFPERYCYVRGKKKFAIGDRVIRTKNKMIELSDGHVVLNSNGDIGTIIDGDPRGITVEYDRNDIYEPVNIPNSEIKDISLAYCLTVHKYQGSQCKYVIIPAHPSTRFLFDKTAFYTAVTRASKKVIIITPSKKSAHQIYKGKRKSRKSLVSYNMKNYEKDKRRRSNDYTKTEFKNNTPPPPARGVGVESQETKIENKNNEKRKEESLEDRAKRYKQWSWNYYARLNVDQYATADEIKKAFRALSLEYHPDVNKDHDTTSIFQDIVEAYDTLKDDEKRRKHDEYILKRSTYSFFY